MTPFFGLVKQHRGARTWGRRRLQLEALEERCVLSTGRAGYKKNGNGIIPSFPDGGSAQRLVMLPLIPIIRRGG
jgi:hypothetical protein